MLAVRLDEQIEKELDMLAKVRGSNRSAVVREAILQYLEDNEDLALAKTGQKPGQEPQALSPTEKRTWPGRLRSAMWLNGSFENWTGRFKSGFLTGSTIESRGARTPGTLGNP